MKGLPKPLSSTRIPLRPMNPEKRCLNLLFPALRRDHKHNPPEVRFRDLPETASRAKRSWGQ